MKKASKKPEFQFRMIHPLLAISPVDGRYRDKVEELALYVSEMGLMKYRFTVEIEYFIALCEFSEVSNFISDLTSREKRLLRSWCKDFSLRDAEIIKRIEAAGYGKSSPKKTNHDVNSIVRYIVMRMWRTRSLRGMTQWVHFALTSEDITNIAYALMLSDVLQDIILPQLWAVQSSIRELAMKYTLVPMLTRTHNQPATPTTLSKEFNVFSARLTKQLTKLAARPIEAKLTGASGNLNAHYVAFPQADWISFSENFINSFNTADRLVKLEVNMITNQIEPHDTLAELFDNMKRLDTILIKFCRDMWQYIGDEWIVQMAKEGEDGSSAMPQKVNPIQFENGEGNAEFAGAIAEFFSRMLPQSRLQRHLSDSTVERNFGVCMAHNLIAYKSILSGLGRATPNPGKIIEDLEKRPEVISEAIQIILRREGISDGYDRLKKETRGREVTLQLLRSYIRGLTLKPEVRAELLKLRPSNYTGVAEVLTQRKV